MSAHSLRPAPSTSARRHYPLVRPARLSVDVLARRTGLHPDLIHRFVALGLLEAGRGPGGELWFPRTHRPGSPGSNGCGPGSP